MPAIRARATPWDLYVARSRCFASAYSSSCTRSTRRMLSSGIPVCATRSQYIWCYYMHSSPTVGNKSTSCPLAYNTGIRYPSSRFWAALRQTDSCTDYQVPVDRLQYVPSICVPFPTFRLDNPRAGPQHSAIMLRARKGDHCGAIPTRAGCLY